MNIKEDAKLFAINAHQGQVRKNEPDKPMIMHPIRVGILLEEYGYDNNVVAAGYLHDVVEDTSYSIEDIEKEFGNDVAILVKGASELDKKLSWERRKKHTIDEVKTLPFRNKVIVCADKIDNLEDLMLKFDKSGKRDFSKFNRGEELQKWYYTSIYKSLIYGEDENNPIFKKLKSIIEILFEGKEDLFLKHLIFKGDEEYYKNLQKLHAQKLELKKLKSLCELSKPYIIEFSGTPRTGKTTIINNLYDFFKKGGFKTTLLEEFTTSKYYRENLKNEFRKMSPMDMNIAIVEEVYKQLNFAINSGNEIVLIDRSINDRQIWNYRSYAKGDISEEEYVSLRDKYKNISKELIDFLVITFTDPQTSLKRDYNCSLALEPRRFMNLENIEEYNSSFIKLQSFLSKCAKNSVFLDTTSISIKDISIEIAGFIMFSMREKYIDMFKNKYKVK